MQIYYSTNSPYARIVRIAAIEAGLVDRIELIKVVNRSPDSPLLAYSPVCRVPTLVDGDLVLGEARNICGYFDWLTGTPRFIPDEADWRTRAEESVMSGFLDGIAVWVRELRRQPDKRSDSILSVEAKRAARCLEHFEKSRVELKARPAWDFGHIALACALEIMDLNQLVSNWSGHYSLLSDWFEDRRTQPAMKTTKPLMAATQQAPLG
ncbi:MAG: glutathione S-transferase family protein [Pseudomonadota bacterium]